MKFYLETLVASSSTHRQQEHQSTQCFIHILTQCYTQEATTLQATQDREKERNDKKCTPFFFQLGDHIWLLLDKYKLKHQHHLQHNFPSFVVESRDASESKQGGIGPPGSVPHFLGHS
jgi:hypothetical protein